jgi:hypothetical protein
MFIAVLYWCTASSSSLRSLRELRTLADKISTYGRKVHQRYPTGDVVVSESDLAEQLRKRPDLLGEHKVQKAPLNEYWKLNG